MKNELEKLVEPLLEWYDRNARVLPWREDSKPYRVWISEIMLQQTRVEAVKPYFERFMQRLPEVEELAKVRDEELLKLWEGLGYYNRARNLKKAAQIIAKEYDGQLPMDYEELIKLPGIGSYTAGAISSIAYGQVCPAVDGNVMRVISRAICYEEDVLSLKGKKQMEEMVRLVIPKNRPGAFNQALMELGATVCVPNGEPHCAGCPWEKLCRSHLLGTQANYPHKTKKKPRVIEEYTIVILQDAEKTAIRKRPMDGLLAGLYEFPWLEGKCGPDEVLTRVKEWGYAPIHIEKLSEAKHIFSHKEWQMIGYAVRVDELAENKPRDFVFARGKEAEEKYPMPAAFLAYTRYLNIRLGNERFSNEL